MAWSSQLESNCQLENCANAGLVGLVAFGEMATLDCASQTVTN
jgi:hypothetical protein